MLLEQNTTCETRKKLTGNQKLEEEIKGVDGGGRVWVSGGVDPK